MRPPTRCRLWAARNVPPSAQVIGGSDTYLPTCRTCFNADRSVSLSVPRGAAAEDGNQLLGTPSSVRRVASRAPSSAEALCLPMGKLCGTELPPTA